MEKKKILYYETQLKASCNYYDEIRQYLKKVSEFKEICSNIQEEILSFKPDLLIIGFTATNIGEDGIKVNLDNINVPLYIILNKEYQDLDKKLNWIKSINPSPKKVFTVHHDFKKYMEYTNIPTHRIMWSANENIFKKYDDIYKYDLFFSGVIRPEQTDNMRGKIYNKLDKLNKYKLLINASFYQNNKFLKKSKNFSNEEYAMNINHSKIVLTTTGPADLVGTRYFELMASNKALILCNRMPENIYDEIVIDKFNCIMFDDENDFVEKCKYYLNNEEERIKIVNQAYKYFLEKHTWDHKVNNLIENL